MMLTFLEWSATIILIIGAVMVTSPQRRARFIAFWLFMFGNTLMWFWAVGVEAWGVSLLYLVFNVTAVIGIKRNWADKPEQEKSSSCESKISS